MKGLITISLDIEIVEKLKKERNKSGLIENLLKRHFLDKSFTNKTPEQLKMIEETYNRKIQADKDWEKLYGQH